MKTKRRSASDDGDVRTERKASIDTAPGKTGPAFYAKIVPAARHAHAMTESKRRLHKPSITLRRAAQQKASHTLRNLLLVLGLGGIGYLVYRKLAGGGTESWTDAGTGRPAGSRPDVATASDIAAEPDLAAADPDLAAPAPAPSAPLASEETVESPVPTTPDSPLKRKKVE